MPDLPSRLDLYALGRDYLLQRAKKIDPAQVDVLGSDANIFVGSTSMVAGAIVSQLGYSVSRLLLDGAENEDLDRYVFDRYNESRKGASPAVGSVRIYRGSVSGGAGTIPIGTKVVTLSGTEYITVTLASFGVSDLFSSADVRATQAGKITQVGANQIRKFGNANDLFDKTLQVNNDLPTAGGEDREDDDTFKNRVRDFWNVARRGILGAIVAGALSVPGVVSASAVEALSNTGMPARVINLYIADSSGVASNALAKQVLTALDDYRAAGIAVIISTSIPFIVTVTLSLTFSANVDTLALSDSVRASVFEFINALPVNGTLYTSQIQTVLQRFASDGLIVNQNTIVAPVGDLVPAIGQTLRTTLANITVLGA